MAKGANPVVDPDPDAPEMVYIDPDSVPAEETSAESGEEAEAQEPEGQDEPSADDETESTDRRSRRAGKEKKPDLSQSEEFRKFQAAADKRVEAERQKRIALEQQIAQQQQVAAQAQLQQLHAQLNQTYDDGEKQQLIEQIADVRAYGKFEQWRAWNDYTAKRIKDEGLDPEDFANKQYQGDQGAVEFERDVAQAAKKKLAAEAAEYKKAASADTIKKLVAEQVARALQAQGLNATDLSEPETSTDRDAERDRDDARLQRGVMSPDAYAKKWEGRR